MRPRAGTKDLPDQTIRIFVAYTLAGATALIKAENLKWAKVIKDAHVQLQ
jgi:hypothetical protein